MRQREDCIYLSTITLLDRKPRTWCAFKLMRIKGRGMKKCSFRKPIKHNGKSNKSNK